MEKEKKVFVRNDDCAYRVIEGKALIVLPGTTSTYLLNDTGARIWELLDGKNSEEAIGKVISKEFEVKGEDAAKDVTEFLSSIEKEGIITLKG